MQIAPRLAVVLLDLLDRFAVGFAELLGQNNLNFGQQIAGRAVFRRRRALLREAWLRWKFRRNAQCHDPFRRRDIDLGPCDGLAQRDGHGARAGDFRGDGNRRAAERGRSAGCRPACRRAWRAGRDRGCESSSRPRCRRESLRPASRSCRKVLDGQLHLAAGDRCGERYLNLLDQIAAACPAAPPPPGALRYLPAARRNWPKRSPKPAGPPGRIVRPGTGSDRRPRRGIRPIRPRPARARRPTPGLRPGRFAPLYFSSRRRRRNGRTFPCFSGLLTRRRRSALFEIFLRPSCRRSSCQGDIGSQIAVGLLDIGLRGVFGTPRTL